MGDRRAARRQETIEEIVAAAWDIVREEGLAGLSMRDLGSRVGMKAQSLYSYFASKNDIYDAMFHQGYLACAAALAVGTDDEPDDPRQAAHRFFDFCTADPVRYQLLFQRTIPDFEPSAESYAVALGVLEAMEAQLASIGVTDPAAVDLWTAMLTGLTDQQISNDPSGDRWKSILDRAVDMTLREITPSELTTSPGGNP
jgi:AcrR family transcriptional regulator